MSNYACGQPDLHAELQAWLHAQALALHSPLAAALRAVLESHPRQRGDLAKAALMEKRRELCLLNQRIPALNLLAGLASLPGLPGAVLGTLNDFQQVAENPDVPVVVRADEQSAFRYFVKVMDAVMGAATGQLTIETGPGL